MASESMCKCVIGKLFKRSLCIINNPKKIEDPGMTVKSDESWFSRHKYNRGKMFPNQWIFGGICKETREVLIYAVSNKTKEMLLETIIS